jgi:hypothetical protein
MIRELAQTELSYTDISEIEIFKDNIFHSILLAKGLHGDIEEYDNEYIMQEFLKFQNMPVMKNELDMEYRKIGDYILKTNKYLRNSKNNIELTETYNMDEERLLEFYYSEGLIKVNPMTNEISLENVIKYEQTNLEREKYEYLQEVELKSFKSPGLTEQEDGSKSGIQAFCFQNKEDNSLDIIYRGTDRVKDFLVDVKMGLAYAKPIYFDEAVNFAYANIMELGEEDVHLLGHSLGGSLATYVHHVLHASVNSKTTTFNAWNVYSLIESTFYTEEKKNTAKNFAFQTTKGNKEFLGELNDSVKESAMTDVPLYNLKEEFGVFNGHKLGEVYPSLIMYDLITKHLKQDKIYDITDEEFHESLNDVLRNGKKPILKLLLKTINKDVDYDDEVLDAMSFEEIYTKISGEDIDKTYDSKISSKMKRLGAAGIVKSIKHAMSAINTVRKTAITASCYIK